MSTRFKVGFVSNQELHDVLVAVFVDFSQPGLNILEGLSVSDIIDKDDAVSSLVVRSSDSFEPFLAGSVPDLKLNGAASRLESSDLEINSNSWQETEWKERYL